VTATEMMAIAPELTLHAFRPGSEPVL